MHSGGVAVACAVFGHKMRLRFPTPVGTVVVVRGNASLSTPASAKLLRSARDVMVDSTDQLHDAPSQVSTEQTFRSSQRWPASAGPVQKLEDPEQVTGGRQAGEAQTRPASRSGFVGQRGLTPSHTASASQGSDAGAHTVLRKRSIGHDVEVPEQRSSASQTPCEGRQMTPPSTGTVVHWFP
jgi:hypothetical protein